MDINKNKTRVDFLPFLLWKHILSLCANIFLTYGYKQKTLKMKMVTQVNLMADIYGFISFSLLI
jgi:hypothetical protein